MAPSWANPEQSSRCQSTNEEQSREGRIPLDMLTAPGGSFIKPSLLYKYPGIDRDQSLCTYKAAWQGYMCSTIDHKMMVIESMDEDTRKHL